MRAIGRTTWVVPDGWLPDGSTGPPEMLSHEAACFLNSGDDDAHVTMTVFFDNREPAGPYAVVVPARRTVHVRLDELSDPEPLPKATVYAYVAESDVPVVLQHSRLDSRQAANTLMTTIAFSE